MPPRKFWFDSIRAIFFLTWTLKLVSFLLTKTHGTQPGQKIEPNLRCGNWRYKLDWKCSECGDEYHTSIKQTMTFRVFFCLYLIYLNCHQSGRCARHSRPLHHRARPRYIGPHIPLNVSQPIRAGLLFAVEHERLRELIVDILKDRISSIESRCKWADFYIGLISGFSAIDLIDNCFWGGGTRQCRKEKRGRQEDTEVHVFDEPITFHVTGVM